MSQTFQGKLFKTSSEHFRAFQLQVLDWGTFSDLHTIPIAEKGYLVMGPSGSGKSTLLDAFSALLVPPKWIHFNAAAQEGDKRNRDRNWVSYIRGAWGNQDDLVTGEVATEYLRSNSTWSALALSFRNEFGKMVVLVQLFWIKGTSTGSADVKRYYLIFERPFDLMEVKDFNLDPRILKQLVPDAFARDDFGSYCEHFRRLLGIESEKALELLHKTQSAKNIGNINSFLREFMLDKPRTFDIAERLVSEFSELSAAHQSVVTAREQVQVLAPARESSHLLHQSKETIGKLQHLRCGLDDFQESRRTQMLEERIETLWIKAEGFIGEVSRSQDIVNNHKLTLEDLNRQHRDAGGDHIQQLENEKNALESQRFQRQGKRNQAQEACNKLGWSLPDNPRAFAELTGKARQEVESYQQFGEETEEKKFHLDRERAEATKALKIARFEVEVLQRQQSNIPSGMLNLRSKIAVALGLAESSLPFIGELIEVKQTEGDWQGAIERVLYGFGLSMLVSERNYSALSKYVNDTNLGKKLIYYKAGKMDTAPKKIISGHSLVEKLKIKEGYFTDWLRHELNQRFDYSCVDSVQAFRQAERALTREGLIRHGKSRHEKDDRRSINDRHYWILGSDNSEKRALFVKQAQEQADIISQLEHEIQLLKDQEKARVSRAFSCQTLANMQWQEVDVATLIYRINEIDEHILNVREGNLALQEIGRKIEAQTKLVDTAKDELTKWIVKSDQVELQAKEYQDTLNNLKGNIKPIELDESQKQGLESRFSDIQENLTLENLDKFTHKVDKAISTEIADQQNVCNQLEKKIEACFIEFKHRWKMDAGDLNATIDSATDFLAKLQRLETDRLPSYEEKFLELLKNQSQQNLLKLSSNLRQERSEILERMASINETLSSVEYSPGTYLRIDTTVKQSEKVKQFQQDIRQALEYAFTNEDSDNAESRFLILKRLVEQLGSQEHKKWRDQVLDVRQHVEFIGREVDQDHITIESYESGAGKSGGQLQKLATSCLAAALKYQLAGNDQDALRYTTVILDEGFNKADADFTTQCMKIFESFGFQMIVANPIKTISAYEPFIGGACYVAITNRSQSSIKPIEICSEKQQLIFSESMNNVEQLISAS